MSKRVAGNRGLKARNYQYQKLPRATKRMIQQLRRHQSFIKSSHESGLLDTEKFNFAEEMAYVKNRITKIFSRRREGKSTKVS